MLRHTLSVTARSEARIRSSTINPLDYAAAAGAWVSNPLKPLFSTSRHSFSYNGMPPAKLSLERMVSTLSLTNGESTHCSRFLPGTLAPMYQESVTGNSVLSLSSSTYLFQSSSLLRVALR